MKRIFYSIIMLAAVVGSMSAQSLSVQPVEVQAGGQTQVVVSLTGGTAATALQFNLRLPEGLTANANSTTLGTATDGHTLSVQTLDSGDLLFVLYSTSLNTFMDGELLRIPVTAGNNAVNATGQLYTVRTASVSGNDAVSQACDNAVFSVTVSGGTVTKTISAGGYATYCSPYALDFSSVEGLTAYIATVSDKIVTFEPVTSVPAQTGVLLKGSADTYEIPVIGSSNTDVTGNALVGVVDAVEMGAGIYVLMNGTNGVGFYKTTGAFTVGANTAYLPAINGARSFFGINLNGEEVTGIGSPVTPYSKSEDHIFNLQGQRIEMPTKGLYVKQGKKVIK